MRFLRFTYRAWAFIRCDACKFVNFIRSQWPIHKDAQCRRCSHRGFVRIEDQP